MIEILTGASVLLTAIYAYLTYQILRANRASVQAMEAQTTALTRPYIGVTAGPQRGSILFLLTIANLGRTAAVRVKLGIDQSFYQFGERDDEKDLAKMNAFSSEIAMIAPGAEINFHLGTSMQIYGGGAAHAMPQVFTIVASYHSVDGQHFAEQTTVDLRAHYKSAVVKDRGVEELKEIAEGIKALAQRR